MLSASATLQEQRKGLKAQRRAALSGKALHDDFADDVAELVAAAGGADGYCHSQTTSDRIHVVCKGCALGDAACSNCRICAHTRIGGVCACRAGDDMRDRRLVSQRYGADAAVNPKGRSGARVHSSIQVSALLACRSIRCGVQAPHWLIWTPSMRLCLLRRLLDAHSCCVFTGDEDLPVRDPLHERRARYDSVKARHAAADGDAGGKRARNADDADYQVGTLLFHACLPSMRAPLLCLYCLGKLPLQ
jgi:hypothetical protein